MSRKRIKSKIRSKRQSGHLPTPNLALNPLPTHNLHLNPSLLLPVHARTGFTLFELVLVLAILVIFSALAYPSVNAFYSSHQMRRAADMVRTSWAEARAHAIDEARPYRFAIVPNKGNYRIAPHAPEYWSSDPPPAPADPANPPLVLSDALPKGLRFSTADAAGPNAGPSSLPAAQVPMDAWSTKVIFLADGTAKSDVEIAFGAKGTRELNLRLRGLTGAVTVRWSPNRENP
jgi:prepilin-type N-terminal cleavage/methylation domain-containing protein